MCEKCKELEHQHKNDLCACRLLEERIKDLEREIEQLTDVKNMWALQANELKQFIENALKTYRGSGDGAEYDRLCISTLIGVLEMLKIENYLRIEEK